MPGAWAIVCPPAADATPVTHAAKQSATIATAASRTPIRLIVPLLLGHVARESRAKHDTPPLTERQGAVWRDLDWKFAARPPCRRHNGPPMRMKLAIALVAPLVLLGGCGGSKNVALKVDGPVVPWSSSQPSELAERSPSTTPCRAADLAMHGKIDF